MLVHRRSALRFLALGAWLAASPTLAADETPDLAGTWKWKWKDAEGTTHNHTLEVEGSGDKMTGRERFDDETAVKVDELKLSGKKITFSVTRKGRRAEYKGTVAKADTINGDVTVTVDGQASEFGWTATKDAGKK